MYAMHPNIPSHPFARWFGGHHGSDDERHGREHGDHRARDPRGHDDERGYHARGPRGPLWLAMAGGGPRRGPGGRGHGPFGGGPGPFGPGSGLGGPFGGRGPRARRGDMRSAILRLLAEQPMHGYQIIQELSSRTGGVWSPSPGSVYPTLAALEDQGLIRAEEVEGKRVFDLTDAGQTAREADAGRAAPWDDVAAGTGDHREFREVVKGLVGAAAQVAAVGTPGQLERAVSMLRETRRKLYQLLAEDPEVQDTPQG